MAITVIVGLSAATLLTLVVIPTLYYQFTRDRAPVAPVEPVPEGEREVELATDVREKPASWRNEAAGASRLRDSAFSVTRPVTVLMVLLTILVVGTSRISGSLSPCIPKVWRETCCT